MAAIGSSTNAASIIDTGAGAYWGGVNSLSPTYTDIIGTSHFEIFSADVNRNITGAGTNDLQVVIHTNYNPASSAALGTGFGSLFLGSAFTPTGTGPHYETDTFTGAPGVNNETRFQYVFAIPTSGTGGTGKLYELAGDGSDVQLSYYPNPSDTGNTNFRNYQAVGYKGSDNAYTKSAGYTGTDVSLLGGSWSFDSIAKTLTFLIENENGLLGTDFAVAWAMTCANDVLLGNVHLELPPGGGDEVPLPAGFVLMGTVLFGAGGVARWRRRRERN